jgi:hypothetical protein
VIGLRPFMVGSVWVLLLLWCRICGYVEDG